MNLAVPVSNRFRPPFKGMGLGDPAQKPGRLFVDSNVVSSEGPFKNLGFDFSRNLGEQL